MKNELKKEEFVMKEENVSIKGEEITHSTDEDSSTVRDTCTIEDTCTVYMKEEDVKNESQGKFLNIFTCIIKLYP